MKYEDDKTLSQVFQKNQQQLSPRNERNKRNPKLLSSKTTPSAPKQMQVHPNQVKRFKRSKIDQANLSSMKKAMEFQMKLATEMPSFVKLMFPSHVDGWHMRLPADFHKLNMVKEDCYITLVDESSKEYQTNYLAGKGALSAGWARFSKEHKFVMGDSLVFQFVEATKFKVYIIRGRGLTELSEFLAVKKETNAETEQNGQNGPKSVSNTRPSFVEKCAYGSEKVRSEDLGGIKLENAASEFKDISNFEEFTIIVNGLNIDSELPKHVRRKYYDLCRSQKSFLHDNLLEGINFKLIAGTISEIVNVADALRVCKLINSQNELASWDKSLNAFEMLGMNVSFLRARLQHLMSIASEFEGLKHSKIYNQAVNKRAFLEDDFEKVNEKLKKSKREFERLELKSKILEVKFEAKVNAPW